MSCEICQQSPHHPRCPNAPEPPHIGRCESCGEKIYEGEDHYEIAGYKFCEICVDDGYKPA